MLREHLSIFFLSTESTWLGIKRNTLSSSMADQAPYRFFCFLEQTSMHVLKYRQHWHLHDDHGFLACKQGVNDG